MHLRIFSVVVMMGVFSMSSLAASVSEIEVQRAQVEMINRVSDAATRYAREIELDESYVSYCEGELYLKTYKHPSNGHVPFGVDYRKIEDSERLNSVIPSRETYEKSFLIVCLANVKNALRDAARH